MFGVCAGLNIVVEKYAYRPCEMLPVWLLNSQLEFLLFSKYGAVLGRIESFIPVMGSN